MAKGSLRDASKEAFWRDAVARQRASGLSVRAFCLRQRRVRSANLSITHISEATEGVNARLVARLDAWRTYTAGGGALDMEGWVSRTQGAPWGTGFKSGYGAWIESIESVHGNSLLSTRTCYLYRLEDAGGNLLKWGITQDLNGRYSAEFLADKNLFPIAQGRRADMLRLERDFVETYPGPLNHEPWAGARIGGW